MKLRLNLSTKPYENKRPFIAAAVFLGSFGTIALLVLSHAAFSTWRSSRELRLQIARWESEISTNLREQKTLAAYFHTPQAQEVMDRAGFLNTLIDQRSFPWTKIFMDLEDTLPAGVRVVNISPKLDNGRAQVEITVGAATDEGKIKFLEALEKSKAFSDIQVKSERHETQAGSVDKIQLQLSAWYATT
jgi:Fimbrial assembly protein (PilN)